MLHHVAPPQSFQMDIMFDKKVGGTNEWAWLLLINVNTRKLWCRQLNQMKTAGNKAQISVLNALHELIPLIQSDGGIRNIRCDAERSFIAKDVVNYLTNQDPSITIAQVPQFEGHSNHTSLAIIDRVIRTIRDDAVKQALPDADQYAIRIGTKKGIGLTPDTVPGLVEAYNARVHSSLKMAPNKVSPADEQKLMDKVSHKNQEVVSSKGYKIGNQDVRIHRQFDPRNKHDRVPYYEHASIVGKRGAFYTVVYGGEEFDVPRAKLTIMKN
jgi:hypothetical protein